VSKVAELDDPIFVADLKAVSELFKNELRILSRRRRPKNILGDILAARSEFAANSGLVGIIETRATEIAKEHLHIRTRVFGHDAELDSLLSSKESRRNLTQETIDRLLKFNGPYVLTLVLRNYLSQHREPTAA
jgi:hypothetical protein